MHVLVQRRLHAFRRRVHGALFAGAFCTALGMLLVVAAALLVLGRLLEWPQPEPRPWWALALLVPVAFAAWRVRRGALPPLTRAAHLDQRLGLDGLLLAVTETDGGVPEASRRAWDDMLAARLRDARSRLPHLRWSLLARRVVPAAVLLGAVAVLPAPATPLPVVNRSIVQALDDLSAALDLARQEGILPDDKLAELVRRARELRDGQDAGREATWADVDELTARLQQERALQQDALAKTAHALHALQESARNAGPPSKSGSAPDMAAQMDELLQHAAAAGLLDKIPAELDPSRGAKAGDAEAFELLAQALAQAALEQIEARPGAGATGQGEALEDLGELLRGMQGQGDGGEGQPVAGGDVPGRGGVTRGPGHATLELNENFDGDTSALQAHKLPPGRVLPQDWEIMQSRRIDPEVAPVRNERAGSGAAAGAGEAAWQRRLSPGHRAVVREFFSGRRAVPEPQSKR